MNVCRIIDVLKERYPDALCSLEYGGDPWKLLVAGRLSAQCTDERVNIVIGPLFERFPDVDSMAEADISEVEELIRSCGLYHTKARNIVDAAKIVKENFGGHVPGDMDGLLTLPGVGRKIANLVLGDIFGIPGIVADTHCIRINGRLGFYPEDMKDPLKTEKILSEKIPPEEQSDYCHRMVLFGREICSARSPRCGECPLSSECAKYRGDNAEKEKNK